MAKAHRHKVKQRSFTGLINIDVLISEEVSGVLAVEPDDISDYAVKVCSAAGCSHTEINIVFIGDEKMTELNETFSFPENFSSGKNNKSGSTDVLSFDLSDPPFNPPVKPGDKPGSSELLEGEVYVSLDKAKIQAKEYDIPFEKEVVMLVTHGLLHLTGRIHDTPESYRAMVDETERMIAMYWERKE